MAQRARLSAPHAEPQQEWPWHQLKWTSLSANLLLAGDRRMEAEGYLSSGRGLRLAIESRRAGWQPLVKFAQVWQPSRLKGIQVSSDFGTPFLAATQMFDIRPVPRKWLAVERTSDAANRFINEGTIVVTCSGAVGRATLAHAPHEKTLISHDLLRVEVRDANQWGWIYAYLRSPQARAMMTSAQYGHIIKHLETSHLDALPVPVVNDEHAQKFHEEARAILDLRNRAYRLTLEAEARFEKELGTFNVQDWGENGFTVSSIESFTKGRRRLEGSFHNPGAAAIRAHLAKQGQGFTKISDAGYSVWVPGRYKRIPASDGVEYYDSADLLEICPESVKRFADCSFGDEYRGRVKDGWLLVPCSGQVYGIIGSVVMAGLSLDGQVVSNHVMRLAGRDDMKLRAGYLLTALSHPKLGRPLVKALPFGSSVPEIDPSELASLEIVRLPSREEEVLADLAEESASLRATADEKERALSADAAVLIDRFIAGDMRDFVSIIAPQ